MHGDPLCTIKFTIQCGLQHIGVITAARIAKRRDFVDVYAQFSHSFFGAMRRKLYFCLKQGDFLAFLSQK